jgi:hypothetical protein
VSITKSESNIIKDLDTGEATAYDVISSGMALTDKVLTKVIEKDRDILPTIFDHNIHISNDVLLKSIEVKPENLKIILDKNINPTPEMIDAGIIHKDSLDAVLKKGIEISEDRLERAAKENDEILNVLFKNKKLTNNIIMKTLKANGDNIYYLLDLGVKVTEPMMMVAVQSDGRSIEYLLDKGITPSREVIDAALESDSVAAKYLLKHNIDVSEDDLIKAIKDYYKILAYAIDVGKATPKIMVESLKSNRDCFYLIQAAGFDMDPVVKFLKNQISEEKFMAIMNAHIKYSRIKKLDPVMWA